MAGARSPGDSKGLQDLKQQHAERLHLLTLDVADTSSIQARQQSCLACLLHTSKSWCNFILKSYVIPDVLLQDAAKRVSQLTGIDGVDYVINNAGASNPGQSRLE